MIMTSNIGADLIKGGVQPFGLSGRGRGSQEEQSYGKMKDTLMKEIERHFRPEFIGRLHAVIVFKPLRPQNPEAIVEFELRKVMKRLIDHGLKIDLTTEAKEFLIEKGTNTDFGARPLRRAIEQHVEDPLSEEILRGAFKNKNLIRVTASRKRAAKSTSTSRRSKPPRPLPTVSRTRNSPRPPRA